MNAPRPPALRTLCLAVAAAGASLVGCATDGGPPGEPAPEAPAAASAAPSEATGAASQTVYVPVYSHIFRDEGREIDLAVTLSVRNTSPSAPITVTAVEYYDSGGRLVRQYGEGPTRFGPLDTRSYVVAERDRTGGVGANFLVRWEAAGPVSAPLVEAVMIGTAGAQGISFVSRGVALEPGAAGPAPTE